MSSVLLWEFSSMLVADRQANMAGFRAVLLLSVMAVARETIVFGGHGGRLCCAEIVIPPLLWSMIGAGILAGGHTRHRRQIHCQFADTPS